MNHSVPRADAHGAGSNSAVRKSGLRQRDRMRIRVRACSAQRQRLKSSLAALKRVEKLARYPFANGVAWSQIVFDMAFITCAPLSTSAIAAARKLVNQAEHVTHARSGEDEQLERARLIALLPLVRAKLEQDVNRQAA